MLDVTKAINHTPDSPILPLELAGAASDTDSEVSQGGMAADEDREIKETGRPKSRKAAIIERLQNFYVEDPDRETGSVSNFLP